MNEQDQSIDEVERIAAIIFDYDYDEQKEVRPLEETCHEIARKILGEVEQIATLIQHFDFDRARQYLADHLAGTAASPADTQPTGTCFRCKSLLLDGDTCNTCGQVNPAGMTVEYPQGSRGVISSSFPTTAVNDQESALRANIQVIFAGCAERLEQRCDQLSAQIVELAKLATQQDAVNHTAQEAFGVVETNHSVIHDRMDSLEAENRASGHRADRAEELCRLLGLRCDRLGNEIHRFIGQLNAPERIDTNQRNIEIMNKRIDGVASDLADCGTRVSHLERKAD